MASWSNEQVERALRDNGWAYTHRSIENGQQYKLTDGTCIDRYDSGKVVVRGKATPIKSEANRVFVGELPSSQQVSDTSPAPAARLRPVFIVYGHDTSAREQLELLLHRLGVKPIVLQNVPATGDTIIEKLETLTYADFACVLLTPDDEGYPQGRLGEKKFRARQNVVLELGMVLAKLGRRRVAVLVKGSDLERPSDIDGLIYLHFKERVDEVKDRLAASLQEAGFPMDVANLLS